MKIKWFITNVTAVGPPARAECDFLVVLDIFRPIEAAFVVGGGSLWSVNILLSPKNLTYDY